MDDSTILKLQEFRKHYEIWQKFMQDDFHENFVVQDDESLIYCALCSAISSFEDLNKSNLELGGELIMDVEYMFEIEDIIQAAINDSILKVELIRKAYRFGENYTPNQIIVLLRNDYPEITQYMKTCY